VPQPYVHFDIYLSGVGAPGLSRADLIKRIEALHRLDRADAAAFVASGTRIRVRRGIDQDAAMKSILQLQGVGALVEIEPNRPPDEALATLDAIDAQPPAIDDTNPEVQALRNALRSATGLPTVGDRDVTTQPMAPAGRQIASDVFTPASMLSSLDVATDPMALQSLDGEAAPTRKSPLDSVAPAVPAPDAAHAPGSGEIQIGRESTAETNPAHDARFSAPDYEEQPMGLEMVQPTAPAPPPPSEAPADEEPSRCEEHDLLLPCRECAAQDQPVPGRLLKGALRKQPAVRIGLGIALGLGIGYLASMPYADRAERRVAAVREAANVDRYKAAPEAQANAAALDQQAEEQSRNAAIGTIAIWLLVGAGVAAGWLRAT
jgi:hypothetical protein